MATAERIIALSTRLLEIAGARAADRCEAHFLAHSALLRILRRDPHLDRYRQIVETLRCEFEALDDERRRVACRGSVAVG